MPSIDSIVTGIGPVKAHVKPVVAEIADRFGPLYFVWGAPGRGTGDHAKGLALDFMAYELGGGVDHPGKIRIYLGDDIARYVIANRVRLNVTYVIWRKCIASAKSKWKWREYDGDNPHNDHVHVSFKETGTYKPPVEDDDELAEINYEKLADALWDRILRHPDYKGGQTTAEGWLTSMAIRSDKQMKGLAKAVEALATDQTLSVRNMVKSALKDVG